MILTLYPRLKILGEEAAAAAAAGAGSGDSFVSFVSSNEGRSDSRFVAR